MYILSDDQIEYILSDITRRGIVLESLRNDLLDHVCCLIEEKMPPDADFETYYHQLIQTFYKKELRELEEETIALLKNKNYYVMKKIMIISGVFSASMLSLGIFLKFNHMPAAGASLVLGITCLSFLFLPLLFAVQIRENKNRKENILLGVGIFAGILISLSIMFKIQHWPFANIMGLTSIGILALIFLPLYYTNGIKKKENKINTLVITIVVIMSCGLFLSLVRSPYASRLLSIQNTSEYFDNEQILKTERKLLLKDNDTLLQDSPEQKIYSLCENIKSIILQPENNSQSSNQLIIPDEPARIYFNNGSAAANSLSELNKQINEYNTNAEKNNLQKIPGQANLNFNEDRIIDVLNHFFRIQMIVTQNERLQAKGI
jgi:hypothetical protein